MCLCVCVGGGWRRRMVGHGRALRARDERIPSYGMRAQRFKGLPACPLFKCMLNARGDARDSLINPLTSHPRWEPHRGRSIRVFHCGTPQYCYAGVPETSILRRRRVSSECMVTWLICARFSAVPVVKNVGCDVCDIAGGSGKDTRHFGWKECSEVLSTRSRTV